jgi:hypothetical protein
MAFDMSLTRGLVADGVSISKRLTVSVESVHNVDISVANGTDQLVAFVCDVSQLKCLYIVADGALVIETNSSSAAANTITLAANVPFQWIFGDNPLRDTANAALTTDITSLYVTNATGGAVHLQLFAGIDPTV